MNRTKGALQLTSQPGQGTTVNVYLPVVARDASGDEVYEQTASGPWHGSGTILLVEDEEQVLGITNKMLRSIGYNVIATNSPLEAIDICSHVGVNLIFSDLIMPGMNGIDMYKEIIKYCPDIPILFTSGYTREMIASKGIPEDKINFIQKPFSVEKLNSTIKRYCR